MRLLHGANEEVAKHEVDVVLKKEVSGLSRLGVLTAWNPLPFSHKLVLFRDFLGLDCAILHQSSGSLSVEYCRRMGLS